jgi:hyaluronan synthase
MDFSWVRKPNGGKKSAHARTFEGDSADVFVTVDSDTCLERFAIEEGLKPFRDWRVQSVAGIELAANHARSLLVKLKSVNTLVWQFITCSAQNVAGGDVLVNRARSGDGPWRCGCSPFAPATRDGWTGSRRSSSSRSRWPG